MPLTDIQIRSAKPGQKLTSCSTAAVFISKSALRRNYWRWKYRFAGKEKRLVLGVYPDIGWKTARGKRDSARQQLGNGIDPGEARRAEKVAKAGAESFEAIAREWYEKFSGGWVSNHADRILRRLERDIFPWLGKRPIGEITAAGSIGGAAPHRESRCFGDGA